jgi:tetratricopeptide (TPR) repeat protein
MKFSPFWGRLFFLSTSLAWSANDLNWERKQGFAHYEKWNADSTLHWLVPVYRANPGDDSVALAVAEASLWKKDFRTATTMISALRHPKSPQALRVQGVLYEQAGRLPEALLAYDQAIPLLSKPWGTMERRAQVLAWLKRIPEAKTQVQQIIGSKEPSTGLKVRCHVDLALWTAWEKDLDESSKILEKALQLDPKSTEALLLLGQIQEWRGEYPQAKSTYGKILSLDANHAEARLRLGKLQWVK